MTRRARIMIALTMFVGTLLTSAPAALAHADGGQGWWGETNDQQITNVMFGVIAFFPTVIVVFSIIQWRLDKRKHAREDAMKARESSADWRGGW
jgi:type IV secretory pathway VirB2 component (pilin)